MFNPRSLLNSLRRKAISSESITTPTATKMAKTNTPQQQPKPLTPVQQQILTRIEDCYQQAEIYFKRPFARPLTQFTLRGRSAGTAHLQQNRLRFNPVLLRENSEAFLSEVVPHEISHLLCFQLFGKTKPHGREWQSIIASCLR